MKQIRNGSQHQDHNGRKGILCVLCVLCGLVWGLPAKAETQTFTDTVRVVMGSRESQDEVRVYATQEAKRRVLDKVGVYLSGSTEIVRKVEESLTEPHHSNASWNPSGSPSTSTLTSTFFSDSTTVLQRIQTLTVGVVQTEVASEEWKTEGGAFVLYLVCRVTVDKDDALKRLTELLQDKQKVEDYQKVQEEVERLRWELAQLRTDLESAKSEKETKAVKEEVQEKINGLGANDWFEKGLAATNPDDQIACYSLALQLNSRYVNAYTNRGISYTLLKDYSRAFIDINYALQLAPNYGRSLAARGLVYYAMKDYRRAIGEFSLALERDPSNAQAYYYGRALAYEFKGDTLAARQDFQRSFELGNEEAKKELEELQ